jgi:thiol:disulfide interchange protein DsbD
MDFAQNITELIQGNMPLAFGVAFLSGFITSLTPCVYPVIGITVAVFGASEAKSKLHALSLSATFVGGLALMYTSLGVIAGLTGMLFGSLMSNPWVIGVIAVLFIVLSLGMFGVYEMQLPSAIRDRLGRAGGVGYLGALVMGLVSGVVAAPCAGPMVSGILVYVGTARSPVLGGFLLFAYSIGMGLLFLVVGTFAMSLPKSGKWLDGVKDVLGSILLIVAAYFLWGAIGPLRDVFPSSDVFLWVGIGAAVVGFGLIVASHTKLYRGKRAVYLAARSLALVLLVAGASTGVYSLLKEEPSALEWRNDLEAGLAEAKADGKPVMIDFTAEWCAACHEIEKVTFNDARVSKVLAGFVIIQLDMTENTDEDEAIMQRYGVTGLPAVIVFDAKGKEVGRINKFKKPVEFMKILEKVK